MANKPPPTQALNESTAGGQILHIALRSSKKEIVSVLKNTFKHIVLVNVMNLLDPLPRKSMGVCHPNHLQEIQNSQPPTCGMG